MTKSIVYFTLIFSLFAQSPTASDLTLNEKIGQLFMIDIRSKFMTVHDDDYKNAIWAIKHYKVGGFILFSGHTFATAYQLNQFQKLSKIPLLISSDLERGVFQNFPDGIQFPPNMAISATGDPKFAYEQGRITAKEAKALGIHMILAPVLDINNNPKNPIINFRSYGSSADVVEKFGVQMIKGIQDVGLIATAKHFPGHGDTSIDSHSSLPQIEIDMDRLNNIELKPFKTAIDSGLKAIMTGHLSLPLLHNGKSVPATISPLLLKKILRKQLGFKGLIISDAFNMDALSEKISIESAMVEAINAGVDIILMPKDLGKAFSTLKKAVENKLISMKTLDRHVNRILNAKKELNLFTNRLVDLNSLKSNIEMPSDIAISEKSALKSVSLIRGSVSDIKFKNSDKILNITVSSEKSLENPGKVFFKEFSTQFPDAKRLIIDHRTTIDQLDYLKKTIKSYDKIIITLFSRTKANKTSIGIDSLQQYLLKTSLNYKKSVCISFGSPFIASDFSYIKTHIAAYSYSTLMQKAAARFLSDESPISGKIQTVVPKITDQAKHLKLKQLDRFVTKAISDSVFPGASLMIGSSQNIFYQKAYGKFTYATSSKNVQVNSLYDLASLTKVLGTSLAIMKLIDEDDLTLKTNLNDIFDDIENKELQSITIGQLLTHTSGILWHKKFYEDSISRNDILKEIFRLKLLTKPQTKTKYSDLGFMILMKVVEEISGDSFEEFLQDELYDDLNIETLLFNPPEKLKAYIPPTEEGYYHKTLAQGIVHDGNAASFGGVSGHAGLFGNTIALAKIAQLMLHNGIYKGNEILSKEVVQAFTKRAKYT